MRISNEIKSIKSEDDASVTVEGWANKAVIDDVGDLMNFEGLDMRRYKRNPILLYNHDRNLPVGKVIESKITPEGLWVKARISNSADKVVSYVRDLVKEGILKTFSIGFDPIDEQGKDGFNEITKWRLNEISIVTLPANIEAEFSLAKSLQEAKTYDEAKALVMKAMEGEMQEDEVVKPENDQQKPENDEQKPEEQKDAFQECISAKIPKLIEEGRAQDEAVAVAMSMCREEGKCDVSVMTKEAFEFARALAKDCAEPKEPEEKSAEQVATPVPQPSNDSTNFGSPEMDLLKSQLALLGKISEQLGSMTALLAKQEEIVENKPENPEAPVQVQETGAKELDDVAEIKKRIDGIVKSLGV